MASCVSVCWEYETLVNYYAFDTYLSAKAERQAEKEREKEQRRQEIEKKKEQRRQEKEKMREEAEKKQQKG